MSKCNNNSQHKQSDQSELNITFLFNVHFKMKILQGTDLTLLKFLSSQVSSSKYPAVNVKTGHCHISRIKTRQKLIKKITIDLTIQPQRNIGTYFELSFLNVSKSR